MKVQAWRVVELESRKGVRCYDDLGVFALWCDKHKRWEWLSCFELKPSALNPTVAVHDRSCSYSHYGLPPNEGFRLFASFRIGTKEVPDGVRYNPEKGSFKVHCARCELLKPFSEVGARKMTEKAEQGRSQPRCGPCRAH